jgi:predicted nucleotidyltransferase
MGNIFNDDFREFIKSLNDHGVKYILIGDYSVILHGYSRTTGDMDIWVERTEENYKKIFDAFYQFRMPVFDMTFIPPGMGGF